MQLEQRPVVSALASVGSLSLRWPTRASLRFTRVRARPLSGTIVAVRLCRLLGWDSWESFAERWEL